MNNHLSNCQSTCLDLDKVNIQYVSDIHLEFKEEPVIKYLDDHPLDKSDILILAGDIGYPKKESYQRYIESVSKNYKIVLVVAGNHEFYKAEYFDVISTIYQICNQFQNVYFLNKSTLEVNLKENLSIRFIGATLWSFVPKQFMDEVRKGLNDYKLISIKSKQQNIRLLDVKDTHFWHQEEAQYIQNELKIAKIKKQIAIVVTHHAPLLKGVSDPFYDGNNINHAFQSDMSKIIAEGCPNLKYWIFGHTHYTSEIPLPHGCTVTSNQLGYLVMNSHGGYTPSKCISLNSQSLLEEIHPYSQRLQDIQHFLKEFRHE